MPVAVNAAKEEQLDPDMVKVSPPSTTPDEKASPAAAMNDKPEKQTDELEEKIQETLRQIRAKTDKVRSAVYPYAQEAEKFANRNPVLFTYLAIFIMLGIIPVAFFAGFILTATTVILGTAAIGICLSMLTCILLGASILLPVLLFVAVISLGILGGILSLFLAHRFYLHLRAASETSTGEFRPTLDSLQIALADFGTETLARTGLDTASTPLSFGQYRPRTQGPQIKWQFPTATTATVVDGSKPYIDQGAVPVQEEEKLVLSDNENQTPTPTIRRMVEQRIIREAEEARRVRIEQQLRQLEQHLKAKAQ